MIGPLSPKVLRHFFLDGSLRIPGAYPAMGMVAIDTKAGPLPLAGDVATVTVFELVDARVLAIRTVLLKDVIGVYKATALDDTNMDLGNWMVGPELDNPNAVKQFLGPVSPGAIYVAESANIYCQVPKEPDTLVVQEGGVTIGTLGEEGQFKALKPANLQDLLKPYFEKAFDLYPYSCC